MGILNRVTQTSLSVFLEQACELLFSDPEHLSHFFELLIYKVCELPVIGVLVCIDGLLFNVCYAFHFPDTAA